MNILFLTNFVRNIFLLCIKKVVLADFKIDFEKRCLSTPLTPRPTWQILAFCFQQSYSDML